MIDLTRALNAWGSASFEQIFKHEIAQLGLADLPLQQGLTSSSIALADALEVMLISAAEDAEYLRIKAGLFYTGVIAGCNCADDPTPMDVNNEHCVVVVEIDKATAATTVTLLTG